MIRKPQGMRPHGGSKNKWRENMKLTKWMLEKYGRGSVDGI